MNLKEIFKKLAIEEARQPQGLDWMDASNYMQYEIFDTKSIYNADEADNLIDRLRASKIFTYNKQDVMGKTDKFYISVNLHKSQVDEILKFFDEDDLKVLEL